MSAEIKIDRATQRRLNESLKGLENIDFFDEKDSRKETRNTHINIGVGKDISIKELAEKVQKIVGFEGEISWDTTKPNGTPQKLLDVNKLHELGWQENVKLTDGIKKVYQKYINN